MACLKNGINFASRCGGGVSLTCPFHFSFSLYWRLVVASACLLAGSLAWYVSIMDDDGVGASEKAAGKEVCVWKKGRGEGGVSNRTT